MSRVLITGLSSYRGGRLAQELEQDESVEVIVGVSTEDPNCPLERTEFVRVGTHHALLRRIVKAEKRTATDDALYAIARAADGGVRDAESILDQLFSYSDG